jgi:hypothetical protein
MKGRSPKLVHQLRPANDNELTQDCLLVEVIMPAFLPVQPVEVEVFADLLDALLPAANDNGADQ